MHMKPFPLLTLAVTILFQTCTQKQPAVTISSKVQSIDGAFHFYVIGDWGRKGQCKQKELASTMNATGEIIKPEFIISTGDNFYPNGVAGVNDPQWKQSFEDVYTGFYLNCPWYVVLGNHDYRTNPQAEIDYSKISTRWKMPSRYFTILMGEGDDEPKVRFVYIDTSPFELEYYKETKYKDKVVGQDTTAQKIWMDSVLSLNDADWKIVVGHHPFYTGGKRVDKVNTVRSSLEKLFTQHKVDAYFAGHEHDLQHLKPTDKPTHHFVSGAGSDVRPTGKMEYSNFAVSIQGFMIASVTKKEILVQVVDYNGNLLYKTAVSK
jgi:tartrate-resistant acid phosphatase type 5